MSLNQMHGVKFENFYKCCGLWPGAEEFVGKNNLRHDVPAQCDPESGVPTAVKALNLASNTLCLADALRLHEDVQTTGLRFAVFVYEQEAGIKSCGLVHEFILRPSMLEALYGGVTQAQIADLKAFISLDNIPLESEDPQGFARGLREVEQRIEALRKDRGLIQFNPKIGRGDTRERRLQSSASLSGLLQLTAGDAASKAYSEQIGDSMLPQKFSSSARENAAGTPEPVFLAMAAE